MEIDKMFILLAILVFFLVAFYGYKFFKFKRNKEESLEITEEDIKNIVKEGRENGIIEEEEKEMIKSIFGFSDTTVMEVLTPRREVFALDMEKTLGDVWDEIIEQGFSRIPVYEGTIDKIVGILHTKDLLKYDKLRDIDVKLKDIIKEVLFVPITKNLREMLKDFKIKKTHIAVIIDEYGGTEGIVTIEDLIEEILGEIQDEYDQEDEVIKKIGEKIFDIRGDMVVEEVNDEFEINIPLSNEYETISGYIHYELGKMGEVSDQVKGEGFVLKIMEVNNKRIEKVRVIIIEDDKEIKIIVIEIRPRVRVAGVLIEDGKILLIEHKKNDKKYWLIPGGGVDWGESTKEAIIREFKEETNLDIEVNRFLFLSETIAPDKEKHVINLYFEIIRKKESEAKMILGNEENLSDLKFLSKEEVMGIKLYPNIKEQIISLLDGKEIIPYLGLLWDK